MHVATRLKVISQGALQGMSAAVLCGVIVAGTGIARAATPAAAVDLELHLIAELEQHALLASPREQAFLYADLADRMTLLASRQIADGELEKAEATLEKLEACTAKMESNFAQSKSLKKTELLLHLTNRRLTDMARAASSDMKPHVQEALARLNVAQASLLATIFAK